MCLEFVPAEKVCDGIAGFISELRQSVVSRCFLAMGKFAVRQKRCHEFCGIAAKEQAGMPARECDMRVRCARPRALQRHNIVFTCCQNTDFNIQRHGQRVDEAVRCSGKFGHWLDDTPNEASHCGSQKRASIGRGKHDESPEFPRAKLSDCRPRYDAPHAVRNEVDRVDFRIGIHRHEGL